VKELFQPVGGRWEEYAGLGVLRSVIDPHNADNRKNKYIDYIHRGAVSSILSTIHHHDVLDLGCGSGRFSILLSQAARKVIGFDITPEMIQVAQREHGAPNIHYGVIDGSHLPLKDRSIDLILTVWVLQYAARTQEIYTRIIEEYRRVLRPGGRFFAVEQVSFADEGRLLPECRLRLSDYLKVMEKYFQITRAYPIRGARKRSFLQKLVVKRRLPECLYPLCTYLDSRRIQKLDPSRLSAYPYVDYVFYGVLK
jgi:ubiquinone/menaquinone biosynthesis C-methylase UbiE